MSEFVVDRENVWPYGSQREEIVRCRDCKHCRKRDMRAYAGDADQMVCYHFSMNDRCGWLVEPDGFCAWGCRK